MSTPALPPAQQTNPTTSQAELEYRSLREHFERLVRWSSIAISTIVVVAGALLYNSASDARKDASQAIQAARESADREISTIQKAAVDTAKAEAQKAINAAFEKQNVQRMIENTAQKKIDAAVDEAVRRNLEARIDAFRALIVKVGEVSSYGAQLREQYREGLDGLLKYNRDPDPTVKAFAHSTLAAIAADYEAAANLRGPLLPPNLPPKSLMSTIRADRTPPFAPSRVAEAFIQMKKKVEWDVQTFDIPAAENWCAQHKPKCEE